MVVYLVAINSAFAARTPNAHVGPDVRDRASRYSAAFVADLDRDVLFALDDDDLDGWELARLVLPVKAESLDDSTKRVLADDCQSPCIRGAGVQEVTLSSSKMI
jgi:hypothetical protein